MIAGQSKGDYHNNLDAHSNYLWWASVDKTYPLFCKDLQRNQDAARAADPNAVPDPINNPKNMPFYDWNEDRPTRSLVVFQDNCSSHHGVNVLVSSKTKKECLKVLRALEVTHITYKKTIEGNEVDFNYELPETGEFPHGNPSMDQVREGLKRVLQEKSPWSVRRPYDYIIERNANTWGPPGVPGLSTIFAAPNVSDEVAVELTWADGKGWVGNPRNCYEGRSWQDILDMLLDRWYNGKCHGKQMFSHCNKVMERAVNKDYEENDGPMRGKFPDYEGLPNPEELMEWKKKAGMNDDEVEFEEEDDDYDEEDTV